VICDPLPIYLLIFDMSLFEILAHIAELEEEEEEEVCVKWQEFSKAISSESAAQIHNEKQQHPLHCAIEANAPVEILASLLGAFPEACTTKNKRLQLPIHLVREKTQETIVSELIKIYPQGARERDERGNVPLCLALKASASLEVLVLLLGAYPEIVHIPNKGKLPLHVAAQYKAPLEFITELITLFSQGARETDEYGNLPLHLAAEAKCSYATICALVDAYPEGATAKNKRGKQATDHLALPLHHACRFAAPTEQILGLLQAQPKLATTKDRQGNLPLHLALCVSEAPCFSVIEALIAHFPDGVKEMDSDGNLPMHLALRNKAGLDVLDVILKTFPDAAFFKGQEGWPIFKGLPLHVASLNKAPFKFISELLSVNRLAAQEHDEYGDLPIHLALKETAPFEVFVALLEAYPAAAKKANLQGQYTLQIAVENKAPVQCIRELLKVYPEAAQVIDPLGKTALHWAVADMASIDVIACLLTAYPNAVGEKDNEDFVPMHLAIELASPLEVLLALLSARPDVAQIAINKGKTPLHLAAEFKSPPEFVTALLNVYKEGAQAKDENDELPLQVAIKHKAANEVLIALLDAHSKAAEAKDKEGCLLLHNAVAFGSSLEFVARLLYFHPLGAQEENENKELPLDVAKRANAPAEVIDAIRHTYPLAEVDLFAMIQEHRWMEMSPFNVTHKTAARSNSSTGTRSLPLHVALTAQAPLEVLICLLNAYPHAAEVPDELGALPLHLAAQHKAPIEFIRQLLLIFPQGAQIQDITAHYPLMVARENGASVEVIDAILLCFPQAEVNLFVMIEAKHWSEMLPLITPESAARKNRQGQVPLGTVLEESFDILTQPPPLEVLFRLLAAFPNGAKMKGPGGKNFLHIAAQHRKTPLQFIEALLAVYPQGAREKDDNGQTPLCVALDLERFGSSDDNSDEKLLALLFADLPFSLLDDSQDGAPPKPQQQQDHAFSWTLIMDHPKISVSLLCFLVSSILAKFPFLAHQLAHTKDTKGREAISICDAKVLSLINEYLFFLSQYELQQGPLVHKSATAIVIQAQDHGVNGDYRLAFANTCSEEGKDGLNLDGFCAAIASLGLHSEATTMDESHLEEAFGYANTSKCSANNLSENEFVNFCTVTFGPVRKVVLKFMTNKEQWRREIETRRAGNLDSRYVVGLLGEHGPMEPGIGIDSDFVRLPRTDEEVNTGLEGTAIEASYRGLGKWYHGKITRDHGDGTFDVVYSDGEKEKGVSEDNIRTVKGEPVHSVAKSAGAADASDVEMTINVGSEIEINYQGLGKWVKGKVVKKTVEDDGFSTSFDVEYHNPFLTSLDKVKLFDGSSIASYRYCIIMPAADRSLDEIYKKERPDEDQLRYMMRELATAVQECHDKGITHGDLKLLNVLRVDGIIKLIDLDASAVIARDYAGAKFSSGILPPEMFFELKSEEQEEQYLAYWREEREANGELWQTKLRPVSFQKGYESHTFVVKTFRTNSPAEVTTSKGQGGGGEVPELVGLPYVPERASTAMDMWAFGLILYNLLAGESLLKVNRDDDLSGPESFFKAATWTDAKLATAIRSGLSKKSSPAAIDLLTKLLCVEPIDRYQSMADVLAHPFITNISADSEILRNMAMKLEEVNERTKAIDERTKAILDKTISIENIAIKTHTQLLKTEKVLLRGIYEAADVQVPSCFLIRNSLITDEQVEKQAGAESMLVKAQEATARSWFDFMSDVGSASASFVEDPKSSICRSLKSKFQGETLYLYLVDEYTMKPVVDAKGIYPLKIFVQSPKEEQLVADIWPLMKVGLKAVSMLNGVAGVARALGYPAPVLSQEAMSDAKVFVGSLDQKSSVAEFDMLQGVAGKVGQEAGEEEKKKVRGQAIRELANFFAKEDKDNYFCGLMRVAAMDGACCWCTQESADEMQRLGQEEFEHGEQEQPLLKEQHALSSSIYGDTNNVDYWQEVHVEGGGSYWWNTSNDETTAVGEPKPGTAPSPPPLPSHPPLPPPPSHSPTKQHQHDRNIFSPQPSSSPTFFEEAPASSPPITPVLNIDQVLIRHQQQYGDQAGSSANVALLLLEQQRRFEDERQRMNEDRAHERERLLEIIQKGERKEQQRSCVLSFY